MFILSTYFKVKDTSVPQSCSKGTSELGERDIKKQRDLWSTQNSNENSISKELLPTEIKK